MRDRLPLLVLAALPFAELAHTQRADALSPQVKQYARVTASRVILEHVQVIDGTGALPLSDRNITIDGGKITAVSAGADVAATDNITVLDLRGYSVMPGIVGMHDHLFYLAFPNLAADNSFDRPGLFQPMTFSAPRLYLANGVTTARTAGSIEPATDLRLKQAIEGGTIPGPHLDVTGPYLEGVSSSNQNLQMRPLTGPDDARETVAYWADRGVTSFKAYKNITRDELSAVVKEAHKRGLKVTGHLCSVTYAEAVQLGIDDLEHGFFVNTEQDPGKKADTCSASGGDYTLEHMTPGGAEANKLIALLVAQHVAVTSTLVSTAANVPSDSTLDGRPQLRPAVWEAMAPTVREMYLFNRNRARPASSYSSKLASSRWKRSRSRRSTAPPSLAGRIGSDRSPWARTPISW